MDRKNQTAPLIGRCDHCLRFPHRKHFVSLRWGPHKKKIISEEMTFFELREAALSGVALSFAPLSVAAAVVAEAEERQGEEEQYKRFAYRFFQFTDTGSCRFI